ncbi:carbohydrate deacetylase [Paenibacillus sp. WQ 127069]|uniref:Carbohydrate deacetylase n=1 Tax=Paenibacillus baimaensis TaxID=2982185 RepID=A0ABT2US95_9BACL|nr:carbohydrate deacetylase [Paenibacillus sp. WQ 127069]MCU6797523.1 carbohydrate deacetylase [Paenibacillus sp. WQ 127069]
MTKYLIINADDFGLSQSINQGIIEAYHAGTVSSTTLMCNMPGFHDAVTLAKKTPSLGVGLHFNLTYGKPLANQQKVSSLVNPKGVFSKDRSKWTEAHIITELEVQFKRFIASGLYPTHLDSHHHIHIDSELVYRALKDLSIRLQIPMRLHPLIIEDRQIFRSSDYLILDTYDTDDGVDRLIGYLDHLPDGITELMCHPGYVDDDVRAYSVWTDGRAKELHVFTNQRIVEKLSELDIQLVNFGFIPEPEKPECSEPFEQTLVEVIPQPIPQSIPKRKTKKKMVNRRKKRGIRVLNKVKVMKLKKKIILKKKKRYTKLSSKKVS